jgi:hypothetical protein
VDEDHHHGPMHDPKLPLGNGVLLWFEIDDFDKAVARAKKLKAKVVLDVHFNPNAQHRELWIADPDGYTVVLASPDGEELAPARKTTKQKARPTAKRPR